MIALTNLDAIDLDEVRRAKWQRGETKETFVFSCFDPGEDTMWHKVHCHSREAAEEERAERIRWGCQVTGLTRLVEAK